MKSRNTKEDQLAAILREVELDKPSEHFSHRLVHNIIQSYSRNYTFEYRKKEWLGKVILAALVCFNLLMLYKLDAINIQPVAFIGIGAFVIGLGTLIIIIKKSKPSTPQKGLNDPIILGH